MRCIHAFRAPWVGLLGFVTVLMWKPVAHTIAVLLHRHFPGDAGYVAGGVIGLVGALLVWSGIRREEHVGTCFGLAGGLLIWIGWMEYSFVFFAETMRVPWLTDAAGNRTLPPQFLVLESTAVGVLLTLYLILIASKETGCRAALWLRKVLRLKPGTPGPGYRPTYARITALEVIFVNWFMYLVIIGLIDSRLFGREHPIQYVAFGVFALWAGYCIVARMPKIPSLPFALRYGVGVVGPAWTAIEIGSYKDFWAEIWVEPSRYPVSVTAITLGFAALAALVYRQRPASPGPLTATTTAGS
jgi:hypothetical protein